MDARLDRPRAAHDAPALGFFYAGLVRSKSSLNTLMMSLGSLGSVELAWALLGYSLAFGNGVHGTGGLDHALLRGVGLEAKGRIPQLLFMAYQGSFAIIAATLISGADQISTLSALHHLLEPARLRACGPLGVRRWMAQGAGSARLRRRHCRAHHGRYRRSGFRVDAWSAEAMRGRPSCRTPCHDGARSGTVVVRWFRFTGISDTHWRTGSCGRDTGPRDPGDS